jgi:tetrahydromethanopterin S-methyltransferase subunit F
MAFISTIFHSEQLRAINKEGVLTSLAHLTRFLLPGIVCGFISAILTAIHQEPEGSNQYFLIKHRGASPRAGMQMAGIGLSLAIGIVAGILIGIIYKLINCNATR